MAPLQSPSTPRPSRDDVMGVLRGVIDPELGSDVVDLGMARDATIDPDGTVTVTVALTTAGCPMRAQLQRDVRHRVGSLPGVERVEISWTEMTQEQRSTAMARARWNAREDAPHTEVPANARVIGVASGKGGVGKSSVTVNLAVALAARGMRIGLLDADIWGFSVPRMLGVEGRLSAAAGEKKMIPSTRTVPGSGGGPGGTIELVSMGLLMEEETDALMWRGLMLNRAVQHFLEDVRWGPIDYLLIDLPPGTGDVQMGLARMLPQTELIIVTTPAVAAQKVAARAAAMARKSYLRIAGVVENMTAFVAPDGTSHAVFGTGGGDALAQAIGTEVLARIPIDAAVAGGGDTGEPVALGVGPAASAFAELANIVVAEAVPPVDMSGCSARLLGAVDDAFARLDADQGRSGGGSPGPDVDDREGGGDGGDGEGSSVLVDRTS